MAESSPNVRLYVGGLTPDVSANELADRFRSFGDVQSVDLIHLCRGFGYVTLAFHDRSRGVEKCIRTLDRSVWNGMELSLQVAKPSFATKLVEEQRRQREAALRQEAEAMKRQRTQIPRVAGQRDHSAGKSSVLQRRGLSDEDLAGSGDARESRRKMPAVEAWTESHPQSADPMQAPEPRVTDEDLREERERSLNLIKKLSGSAVDASFRRDVGHLSAGRVAASGSSRQSHDGGITSRSSREFVQLRHFDPLVPDATMERCEQPAQATNAVRAAFAQDGQGRSVGFQKVEADSVSDFSFGFDLGTDELEAVQPADFVSSGSRAVVAAAVASSKVRSKKRGHAEPGGSLRDDPRHRKQGTGLQGWPATYFEPMGADGDAARRVWMHTRQRATVDYKNKAKAAQRQARKLSARRVKR